MDDRGAPYVGLRPYREADAKIFCGREPQVQRLLQRLSRRPDFLALIGPSGCGKTSLVRAGLISSLRSASADKELAVLHVEHPGHELSRQLLAQGVPAKDAEQGLSAATEQWHRDHPAARHLLFVDHVEEVLCGADAELRRSFFASLERILESALSPSISVVLAVREDFVPLLGSVAPTLLRRVEESAIFLPPTLAEEEWGPLLREPVARAGGSVKPELLTVIAADLRELGEDLQSRSRAGSVLPLLSVAMARLWEASEDGVLGPDAYRRLGGLSQSVGKWAESRWSTLSAVEQERARQHLVELVRMGPADLPALSCPVSAINNDAAERWLPLIRSGLLRRSEEHGLIELTHAALLTEWPELKAWIQEERRFADPSDRAHKEGSAWIAKTQVMEEFAATLTPDQIGSGPDAPVARELSVSAHQAIEAQRIQAAPDAGSRSLPAEAESVGDSVPPPRHPATAKLNRASASINLAPGAPWVWLCSTLLAFLVLLFFGLRWYGKQYARNAITLASEQGAHAALLVRQPGLDGEALALAAQAAAACSLNGWACPRADEGLMVALSVARNSQALYGHRDRVSVVAYSPDGQRIVTGSDDQTARIWDTSTGASILTLHGHQGAVEAVAFSPDGRRILTASADRTARVWDAASGAQLFALTGHEGSVPVAMYSPDGTKIFSADTAGKAFLWQADSGVRLAKLVGHEDAVIAGAFSRDSQMIATSSWDKSVRIWDSRTGQVSRVLSGHTDRINSVQFSPDGELVASGGRDRTVRIWNRSAPEPAVLTYHGESVRTVCFSADGRFLASSDASGVIHLYDVTHRQHQAQLRGHADIVDGLGFSPDSRYLFSAGYDRTVRLWAVHRGTPLAVLRGHPGKIYGLAVAPDGLHATTVGYDRTARVWDTRSSVPEAVLEGHKGRVQHVIWDKSSGSRIITAGYDHTVRIWTWPKGQLLYTLGGSGQPGHTQQVYMVAASSDGSLIASASADGTVRIWEGRDGQQKFRLTGHQEDVFAVAFSPDGSRLASSGEDGTLRLWDPQKGTALQVVRVGQEPVEWVEFSSDGRHLISAGSKSDVRIWDAADFKRYTQLVDYHSPVSTASFVVRNGQLQVITASEDRTVRAWDAQTGKPLGILHTLPDWAVSASPSRDGKRLVIVGKDRAVRLWDLSSEKPLVELPILAEDLAFADYAPDRSHFVVVGSDGTALIYRDQYSTDLRGMISSACKHLAHRPEFGLVRATCPSFSD